jgi:dienelactone hydrolase
MAVRDPAPKILYLARPCQYTAPQTVRGCHVRYWTISRFSEATVAALNRALDLAKKRLKAEHLHLVGYSGGGAMAVLLAARRSDAASLLTAAGNLNHRMWTDLHDVTPLTDSLNPVDVALDVRDCPQVHLAGEKDKVMPPRVIQSFIKRTGNAPSVKMAIVQGFDHECCWADQWDHLLKTYRPIPMIPKRE